MRRFLSPPDKAPFEDNFFNTDLQSLYFFLGAIEAFCSAQDIALLHVGAATLESFENHRFFGISDILTWNEILSIFRRLYPDRDIFEDFDDRRKEDTKYDTKSALELLKEVGQTGWKPIEEAIRENVEKFA